MLGGVGGPFARVLTQPVYPLAYSPLHAGRACQRELTAAADALIAGKGTDQQFERVARAIVMSDARIENVGSGLDLAVQTAQETVEAEKGEKAKSKGKGKGKGKGKAGAGTDAGKVLETAKARVEAFALRKTAIEKMRQVAGAVAGSRYEAFDCESGSDEEFEIMLRAFVVSDECIKDMAAKLKEAQDKAEQAVEAEAPQAEAPQAAQGDEPGAAAAALTAAKARVGKFAARVEAIEAFRKEAGEEAGEEGGEEGQ